MFIIEKKLMEKRNYLEFQIQEIQEQLKLLPKGNFFCCKQQNHYKWYRKLNKKQIYISKKDRPLAEKLAYRKYLSLLLEDSQQELCAINFYLRHHNESKSEQFLQNSEHQRLLSPFFKPLNQELSDWIQEPYFKNPYHPEYLIHKTISGNMVRSKSEAMIDMVLTTHQIPFRYECALQLGDKTIYPDFTIRHPKTGETFYYEHFGRMDDLEYSKSAASKIQLYSSCGIIPSIHLLTTYETLDYPLSIETVEKLVKDCFE